MTLLRLLYALCLCTLLYSFTMSAVRGEVIVIDGDWELNATSITNVTVYGKDNYTRYDVKGKISLGGKLYINLEAPMSQSIYTLSIVKFVDYDEFGFDSIDVVPKFNDGNLVVYKITPSFFFNLYSVSIEKQAAVNCAARTCLECVDIGLCGWCESTNTCVMGTGSGPTIPSQCPTGKWDHYESDCPAVVDSCATKSSCSSCIADSSCGWCSSTNKCMKGSSSGPSSPSSYCPSTSWSYYSCPSVSTCSSKPSCADCVSAPGCGWCSTDNKCREGDAAGPTVSSTCSYLNWFFASCPSYDSCATYSSCSSCVSDISCGWCADTQKCSKGTTSGPTSSTCSVSSWFKYTCPEKPKTCEYYSCTSCTSDTSCAWCPYIDTCQPLATSSCSNQQLLPSQCSSYTPSSSFPAWAFGIIIPGCLLLIGILIGIRYWCLRNNPNYSAQYGILGNNAQPFIVGNNMYTQAH